MDSRFGFPNLPKIESESHSDLKSVGLENFFFCSFNQLDRVPIEIFHNSPAAPFRILWAGNYCGTNLRQCFDQYIDIIHRKSEADSNGCRLFRGKRIDLKYQSIFLTGIVLWALSMTMFVKG